MPDDTQLDTATSLTNASDTSSTGSNGELLPIVSVDMEQRNLVELETRMEKTVPNSHSTSLNTVQTNKRPAWIIGVCILCTLSAIFVSCIWLYSKHGDMQPNYSQSRIGTGLSYTERQPVLKTLNFLSLLDSNHQQLEVDLKTYLLPRSQSSNSNDVAFDLPNIPIFQGGYFDLQPFALSDYSVHSAVDIRKKIILQSFSLEIAKIANHTYYFIIDQKFNLRFFKDSNPNSHDFAVQYSTAAFSSCGILSILESIQTEVPTSVGSTWPELYYDFQALWILSQIKTTDCANVFALLRRFHGHVDAHMPDITTSLHSLPWFGQYDSDHDRSVLDSAFSVFFQSYAVAHIRSMFKCLTFEQSKSDVTASMQIELNPKWFSQANASRITGAYASFLYLFLYEISCALSFTSYTDESHHKSWFFLGLLFVICECDHNTGTAFSTRIKELWPNTNISPNQISFDQLLQSFRTAFTHINSSESDYMLKVALNALAKIGTGL